MKFHCEDYSLYNKGLLKFAKICDLYAISFHDYSICTERTEILYYLQG